MKNLFYILASILFVVNIANASALRNPEIKNLVCEALNETDLQVRFNKRICVNGKIDIVETKSALFEGSEKTTLMMLETEVSGSRFGVEIRKVVLIDEEGQIRLARDWKVVDINVIGQLAEGVLLNTEDVYDDNVKKLKSHKGLPKAITKFSEYSHYAEHSLTYYKIFKTSRLKEVVGFFVVEFAGDEELDEKLQSTTKFNLKAKVVDSSFESWGYHE